MTKYMRMIGNPTPNENFGDFLNTLYAETERGSALAAAAFADELLDSILGAFLARVPEVDELIAGFAAPLGTLSAKIKLSYALGLLDKEIFDGLNAVRKIRNEFAHKWKPANFSDPNVSNLVDRIPDHPILKSVSPGDSPRSLFAGRVAALFMDMSYLPGIVSEHQRVPRRLVRMGKTHPTEEEADRELEEYKRTGIPPWPGERT